MVVGLFICIHPPGAVRTAPMGALEKWRDTALRIVSNFKLFPA